MSSSLRPILVLGLYLLLAGRTGAQPHIAPAAERVAGGFTFVEGPLWHAGRLLFSDIPRNVVYAWQEGEQVQVYRMPSHHSNGLAHDAGGRLLLAQHGARRIARIAADGTEEPLASHYAGKRLNSPNDLAVHPDGSIYFTDPTWGIRPEEAELGFTGVYRLLPDGTLRLLVDSLYQPNGITFSPDFATLYVSTSDRRTVLAYAVSEDGLAAGRLFARLDADEGAADGMKTDAVGRLYVTGPGGVWVYAPEGTLLRRIDVPEQTTNCAWGDPDGHTLYVTSGTGLYRVRIEGGMEPR